MFTKQAQKKKKNEITLHPVMFVVLWSNRWTTIPSWPQIHRTRCVFSPHSLVTTVPVPLISWLDRKEVTGTPVLHFLGETQEDPEVDVSHSWSIGWPWMEHRRHWHNCGKPQLDIHSSQVMECREFIPLCSAILGKVIQNMCVPEHLPWRVGCDLNPL